MKKLNRLKLEIKLDEKRLFDDIKEIFKYEDDHFITYHGECDISNVTISIYNPKDMQRLHVLHMDLRPYLIACGSKAPLNFVEFTKNYKSIIKNCTTQNLLNVYKRFL